MSKRRRKKKDEEKISEAWLLPYADLLTLLLALFIVLFAVSAVDAHKFQQMTQVFNGIFIGASGTSEYELPIEANDKPIELGENNSALSQDLLKLEKIDVEGLKQIEEKVETYIIENGLQDKFSNELTSEGLLITISDNVLFPSGSAEVREEDKKTARELAALLEMDTPRNIIISGHTDNVPIKNSTYQSNWELSVMRAVNFMKLLIENEKLDPSAFSAKGFGEFQPIESNDTPEGREANRRVEVLILPHTM